MFFGCKDGITPNAFSLIGKIRTICYSDSDTLSDMSKGPLPRPAVRQADETLEKHPTGWS